MADKFIHPNSKTFETFQNQNFSFPRDLISHITQNPCSSIGYLKLQKTCKYFFAKNKIIVLTKGVSYQPEYLSNVIGEPRKSYLQKYYFNSFKYWLTVGLDVGGHYGQKICDNFYSCNLRGLILFNQNLTLKELNFHLNGGKINELWFSNASIKNENGGIVSFDQILAKVPNCEKLLYYCENEIFSKETFQKMNSLVFNSKFIIFDLTIHYSTADILLLCYFIQKNASREYSSFDICLKMDNAIDYQSALKSLVKKMLKTWRILNICL